jgi:starvation-inducible DNA-binding protein
MLKTQNYHWNIRGKMFISVHNLTEEMYNELFPAIDVIAERIRSLGFLCPGSMEEFSDLGTVSENHKENSELEMVRDLVTANETVARKCRSLIGLASDHLDEATADLLTSRLALHEKNAWMFRSFLEQ